MSCSEWKEVKLGDICILNYGKALPSRSRKNGNIPVFSSAGITGSHDKPISEGKGIIIGRKGSVGTVFYSSVPFFCIDTAYYVLPNKEYNLKYLFYRLKSLGLQNLNEDSAVPGLNRDTAYAQRFLLPEYKEQTGIAATLSCLDDKIELNNRINKNLEEMAQAIFKRWFVDFEFPDENGNPYKSSGGEMVESELGEIPKGWKVTKFEDAFNFQEGPGIRNWQYVTNGGTKFINIRCIKNNDLFLETANMISNEEANGVYSHFMINEWDVLVSTSGTLGRYAIVRKEHLPLCLNTSVIRFMPKSHFDHFAFMMGYISSEEFINHLLTKASGSVQSNFGPMHLRQISIKYPLDTVIQKYQMLVFPLINQAVKLKSENQLLTKTRDVLLPKLMSGEIRVPCEEAV